MATGTIKSLPPDREFGFILADGREGDLFFHKKQLAPGTEFTDLKLGMAVTFEIDETGPKGAAAVNVAKAASMAKSA